jgi:hypothetical protein
MIEDETFFAWLDGELSGDEAAAVERAVAADPRLSALAEEHRRMQAGLKDIFGQVAAAPAPERLRAAVRFPQANIADLTALRRARKSRRWPALTQWAAMAATLAIGILVGTLLQERGGAPIQLQNGRIYAASPLQHALDTQLASAPSGDVRIGLTFRDQAGQICRSFTEQSASGLACRAGDRWQVRGLFGAPEGQSSDYRMAAGMDPNLAALVDSSMAGEPFDAAQERAARQHGWK